jgi:hypothetical protein
MKIQLMKSLVVGGLLTLTSGMAAAACNDERCTGVFKEAFTSLYLADDGRVLIAAPADRTNLNCTLVEGVYMTLRADHVQFKQIYAALLFAMQSGNMVNIRISTGTGDCKVNYVVIS